MKHLLLLASNWPEPCSSAAGSRTLQLLDLFSEANWHITFMTAADRRPHSAELPVGIETHPLKLNSGVMDDVFRDLDPDLVWFDRFMLEEQYGWRIAKACPRAKRLLDTVDLHSLREIRRTALHHQRSPQPKDWFCDTAMRELASIYRSDLTLLISDAEEQILTRDLNLPASLLHVTPFLLSGNALCLSPSLPPREQRNGFTTIGNFRHPPNADSVRYLHDTIWPALRKACPNASLTIHGADLTPALQQLHQPDNGFYIHGRAENAIETLSRSRVCLAPLRFGAGLKGKLLDAMQAGTPSVTTSIGAEGMQGSQPWPGEVEDDPDRFVEAARALYHDADLWHLAQKRIEPCLRNQFSKALHGPALIDRIHALLKTPATSSPDQLTGALLRHHQHRSTEYMSRWIEEKGRRD